MGNVCHIMPGIHPAFRIETKFSNHHPGFTEYSGSESAASACPLPIPSRPALTLRAVLRTEPQNMAQARIAGKALAGATIDLLSTEGLVDAAVAEYKEMAAANAHMWQPNFV